MLHIRPKVSTTPVKSTAAARSVLPAALRRRLRRRSKQTAVSSFLRFIFFIYIFGNSRVVIGLGPKSIVCISILPII